MVEFFVLPRMITFLATITLTLCVVSQTITGVTSYYRYPRTRVRNFGTALEVLILCHIMLCVTLHVQAEAEFKTGMLVLPELVVARLLLFTLITAAVVFVTISTKKPMVLPVILASGLTLPFIEQLTGYAFIYINLAVIIFWFTRSIVYGLLYRKENKSSLSALSVKIAIDSMITGVMFCQQDGFILLVNERMKHLMTVITGKAQRNGRHFFSLLTLGEIKPECSAKWFEEQNVVILPDKTVWQFSITELPVGKKKYFQLTAIEISELWKITSELQPQNEKLLLRQSELNNTIAQLHLLSRERETQKAKMRAHDILGEHLAVLQSTIFAGQTPDYVLLRALSQELLDELKTVSSDPLPQDELESMKYIFKAIDVEIVISGTVPEDFDKGRLIVEIIREAVNNAVRHGLATQVTILIEDTDHGTNLTIQDNGYPPYEVNEGGGISGMRKKLEPCNGTLRITTEPQFALIIYLPGGKSDG